MSNVYRRAAVQGPLVQVQAMRDLLLQPCRVTGTRHEQAQGAYAHHKTLIPIELQGLILGGFFASLILFAKSCNRWSLLVCFGWGFQVGDCFSEENGNWAFDYAG